ncbi:MAG TPA: LytR C-terminal domain-containing protein [Thermoleophilaceae bacterium]|nr:LytR C-terminal domain-containing protein [Thermoleophilaceae bacterium]
MPRPGASPGGALQQTQIIAPPAAREPWHRRLLANPLRLALSIAGLLIVLAAAAFGASQILDDDSGTPAADRPGANGDAGAGDGGDDRKPAKGKIVPSKVTVAVLNGTTIPGLAAQVGDKVGASGFDVGTVANASTQQRAESVVLFSPGHEREAAAVGRKLRINQREAIDPDSQSVAGDATVVVIAGQDQTP